MMRLLLISYTLLSLVVVVVFRSILAMIVFPAEIVQNLIQFVDLDTLGRTAKANKLWNDLCDDSWNERMVQVDEDLAELLEEERQMRERNPCADSLD